MTVNPSSSAPDHPRRRKVSVMAPRNTTVFRNRYALLRPCTGVYAFTG